MSRYRHRWQKLPASRIAEDIVVVPILRAGVGMLDGILLAGADGPGRIHRALPRQRDTANQSSITASFPGTVARCRCALSSIRCWRPADRRSPPSTNFATAARNASIVVCIVTCPEGTRSGRRQRIRTLSGSIRGKRRFAPGRPQIHRARAWATPAIACTGHDDRRHRRTRVVPVRVAFACGARRLRDDLPEGPSLRAGSLPCRAR